MLVILAFFVSPLALLLAGMPFQALINFVIYVGSFVGVLLFVWPGVLLWGIGVVHAILMIQNRRADRRAQRIVEAIEKSDEPR